MLAVTKKEGEVIFNHGSGKAYTKSTVSIESALGARAWSIALAVLHLVELGRERLEQRGPARAGHLERVLELFEHGISALNLKRRRHQEPTIPTAISRKKGKVVLRGLHTHWQTILRYNFRVCANQETRLFSLKGWARIS